MDSSVKHSPWLIVCWGSWPKYPIIVFWSSQLENEDGTTINPAFLAVSTMRHLHQEFGFHYDGDDLLVRSRLVDAVGDAKLTRIPGCNRHGDVLKIRSVCKGLDI